MNYIEIFGLVSSGMGIAFGFGKQSAAIATLRKDVDNAHAISRDILDRLNAIDKKLERIDERVNTLQK